MKPPVRRGGENPSKGSKVTREEAQQQRQQQQKQQKQPGVEESMVLKGEGKRGRGRPRGRGRAEIGSASGTAAGAAAGAAAGDAAAAGAAAAGAAAVKNLKASSSSGDRTKGRGEATEQGQEQEQEQGQKEQPQRGRGRPPRGQPPLRRCKLDRAADDIHTYEYIARWARCIRFFTTDTISCWCGVRSLTGAIWLDKSERKRSTSEAHSADASWLVFLLRAVAQQ